MSDFGAAERNALTSLIKSLRFAAMYERDWAEFLIQLRTEHLNAALERVRDHVAGVEMDDEDAAESDDLRSDSPAVILTDGPTRLALKYRPKNARAEAYGASVFKLETAGHTAYGCDVAEALERLADHYQEVFRLRSVGTVGDAEAADV